MPLPQHFAENIAFFFVINEKVKGMMTFPPLKKEPSLPHSLCFRQSNRQNLTRLQKNITPSIQIIYITLLNFQRLSQENFSQLLGYYCQIVKSLDQFTIEIIKYKPIHFMLHAF